MRPDLREASVHRHGASSCRFRTRALRNAVDHEQRQHADEHQHAERRGPAEVELGEAGLVDLDAPDPRGIGRAAAGHDHQRVEGVDAADDLEDQRDDEHARRATAG